MHAIVKMRKLDDEGKAVGNMNNNPLLDTRAYKIELAEGTARVLTPNIIANNLLAQVDEKLHLQMILDKIIDHRQDVNVTGKEDTFTKTRNEMN